MTQPKTPLWFKISFWLVLLLVIVASFGNQFLYQYVVPPGYDGIAHATIIDTILRGNYTQIYSYHTLWHMFTIPFVLIFHMPPITALAWLGPLLQVTMVVSLTYFAKRAFGPTAAIVTMIIMGGFSLQPLQTLTDGGYPNVLAAGTILPFFFLVVHGITSTKMRWWHLPLLLVSFIVLIWSHHLTTLYALPIAFAFGLIMIAKNLREKKVHMGWIMGALIILAGVTIVGTWLFLHAPPSLSVSRLAEQFIHVDLRWPFFHFVSSLYSPEAILALQLYPQDIGYVVIYLGILATLWGIFRAVITRQHPWWRFYVLLVIWVLVLFVGSRMDALGFPVRLARDMAIPLVLLCGAFLGEIFEYAHRSWIGNVVIILISIGVLYLGLPTITTRYHMVVDPNSQVHHLSVDTQAADYITNEIPLTARIGFFQESLYLDLFTPKHTMTWITDPMQRHYIMSLNTPEKTLTTLDYLYFEHRTDKDTPEDSLDLLNYYLESPLLTEVIAFKQPEKEVYILKINHDKVDRLLPDPNSDTPTEDEIAPSL